MRKFTLLSYENRDDGLSFDLDDQIEDRNQQITQQFDNLEDEMRKHSYRNVVIFFPELLLMPKEKFLEIVENCFKRIEKIKLILPDNYVLMRTLRLVVLNSLKFPNIQFY